VAFQTFDYECIWWRLLKKKRVVCTKFAIYVFIDYELFGGGIESTTMSILWFIIYMIRHPEVSNEYCKIYEHHEIGCMIPKNRSIIMTFTMTYKIKHVKRFVVIFFNILQYYKRFGYSNDLPIEMQFVQTASVNCHLLDTYQHNIRVTSKHNIAISILLFISAFSNSKLERV
jgi:hypothetical protein